MFSILNIEIIVVIETFFINFQYYFLQLALGSANPVFDGGVAFHTLLLAKRLLNSAVDVGDDHVVVFFFSVRSRFVPSGLHASAVTSPWRKELDKMVLAALDSVVEGRLSEDRLFFQKLIKFMVYFATLFF